MKLIFNRSDLKLHPDYRKALRKMIHWINNRHPVILTKSKRPNEIVLLDRTNSTPPH